MLDIIVDGDNMYEIYLKTGEVSGNGTRSPISFIINGDKGIGQQNILTETGAKTAGKDKYIVHSNDIGNITGFTVALEYKSKWTPVKVQITNLSIINIVIIYRNKTDEEICFKKYTSC